MIVSFQLVGWPHTITLTVWHVSSQRRLLTGSDQYLRHVSFDTALPTILTSARTALESTRDSVPQNVALLWRLLSPDNIINCGSVERCSGRRWLAAQRVRVTGQSESYVSPHIPTTPDRWAMSSSSSGICVTSPLTTVVLQPSQFTTVD